MKSNRHTLANIRGVGLWLPSQSPDLREAAKHRNYWKYDQRNSSLRTPINTRDASGNQIRFNRVAVCLLLLLVFVSPLLYSSFGNHFGFSLDWINSDDSMWPSIGGFAFAIGGCRAFMNAYREYIKTNKKKVIKKLEPQTVLLLAIICGVLPFCAGGGLLRDPLLSLVNWEWRWPWFLSNLPSVIQLQIIVLLLVGFTLSLYYLLPRLTWFELMRKNTVVIRGSKIMRVVFVCMVVIGDTLGLIEFAKIGQQSADGMVLPLVFLFGMMTQIGGGFLALVMVRRRFSGKSFTSMLIDKVPYYTLAASINAACLALANAGAKEQATTLLLIVPNVIVALYIEEETCLKFKLKARLSHSYKNPSFSKIGANFVFIQVVMQTTPLFHVAIKVIERYYRHLSNSLFNRMLSSNCMYHRRQGLLA